MTARMQRLAGVDEAGRGPLAGPVVCASVILHPRRPIEGLGDSKALNERTRERLFPIIQERCLAWQIVFVPREEIDEVNILWATMPGTDPGDHRWRPRAAWPVLPRDLPGERRFT
jgi:ribonuclease HII